MWENFPRKFECQNDIWQAGASSNWDVYNSTTNNTLLIPGPNASQGSFPALSRYIFERKIFRFCLENVISWKFSVSFSVFKFGDLKWIIVINCEDVIRSYPSWERLILLLPPLHLLRHLQLVPRHQPLPLGEIPTPAPITPAPIILAMVPSTQVTFWHILTRMTLTGVTCHPMGYLFVVVSVFILFWSSSIKMLNSSTGSIFWSDF